MEGAGCAGAGYCRQKRACGGGGWLRRSRLLQTKASLRRSTQAAKDGAAEERGGG